MKELNSLKNQLLDTSESDPNWLLSQIDKNNTSSVLEMLLSSHLHLTEKKGLA